MALGMENGKWTMENGERPNFGERKWKMNSGE